MTIKKDIKSKRDSEEDDSTRGGDKQRDNK